VSTAGDYRRRRYDGPMTDPPHAGLCQRCACRRDVVTATSRFVLCTRAFADPAYPKYPRLPVLHCVGYLERAPEDESGQKERD
jgi:hypothetical protein